MVCGDVFLLPALRFLLSLAPPALARDQACQVLEHRVRCSPGARAGAGEGFPLACSPAFPSLGRACLARPILGGNGRKFTGIVT